MNAPRKSSLNSAGQLSTSIFLLLGFFLDGCGGPSYFLSTYEREISSATQSIEIARDDSQRAVAYSNRGASYSERARYSRAMKLISNDEYVRLFDLAIKDHDQAILLDPASAQTYFGRGMANYDRANLEVVVNGALVGNKETWHRGSTRRSPTLESQPRKTPGTLWLGTD